MTDLATRELWAIFDARRVKAPELRGLDLFFNGFVGFAKNRRPVLSRLRQQAERIELLEPEIKNLGSARFKEEIADLRALARVNRLEGAPFDRAVALAREAVVRSLGKRPYPVQLMGALAMYEGNI